MNLNRPSVLFRSINILPQKAGVSADKLRRLVLKELADNALDIGASVRVGRLHSEAHGEGFYVQDDGPGSTPIASASSSASIAY